MTVLMAGDCMLQPVAPVQPEIVPLEQLDDDAFAAIAFGVAAQAKEKHEEEIVSQADVPMAVQKSAESEAKGGRIVAEELHRLGLGES